MFDYDEEMPFQLNRIDMQLNFQDIQIKEEDTIDMLLSLNDEISWRKIGKMIVCRDIDIKNIFIQFFNSKVSNELFRELCDLIISIAILTWNNQTILEYISKSQNLISSMQFEKKEILYRIMKRKIKSNILFFSI